MPRHTRIQGLIIQNHRILLIRAYEIKTGASFWVIPGGGQEAGESDEECLSREMKEETGLDVRIGKLLIEQKAPPEDEYKILKSYICSPAGGSPEPGSEPEVEGQIEIAAVRWFDLRDETGWSIDLRKDPYTYPHLVQVRHILGYTTKK